MKAKVTKAFDYNNPEKDSWCVMIQRESKGRYNIPVVNGHKMVSFDNKKDANIYVERLNKELTNK